MKKRTHNAQPSVLPNAPSRTSVAADLNAVKAALKAAMRAVNLRVAKVIREAVVKVLAAKVLVAKVLAAMEWARVNA